VTLARAAKLAEVSVEEFLGLLAAASVDAVHYPPGELEAEVEPAG
jgi:predicted HTH domain antitoxin